MGSITRADNIQAWLTEATREERPDTDNWENCLDIIKSTFIEWRITVEYALQTAILIYKGNREFNGIGILEVICKSLSGGVNCWIDAAVYFHNTMHIFRAVIITDTTSL